MISPICGVHLGRAPAVLHKPCTVSVGCARLAGEVGRRIVVVPAHDGHDMIGLVGIGAVVLAPFVVVRELAGACIVRKALLGRDSYLDGPRFDEHPLDVVVGLGVEMVECQLALTVDDLLAKH